MQIYTSFYEYIFSQKKSEADVYIQVSRNLGKYENTEYAELIDEDWGFEFGNWNSRTASEYRKSLCKKDLRKFAQHLRELENKVVYLLCFENLSEEYTKEDEIKYGNPIKAGIPKVCHRTWLAEILKRSYGIDVKEKGLE